MTAREWGEEIRGRLPGILDCDDCEQARLLAAEVEKIIAEERERCAKVAESHPYKSWQMNDCVRDEIAASIRGKQ